MRCLLDWVVCLMAAYILCIDLRKLYEQLSNGLRTKDVVDGGIIPCTAAIGVLYRVIRQPSCTSGVVVHFKKDRCLHRSDGSAAAETTAKLLKDKATPETGEEDEDEDETEETHTLGGVKLVVMTMFLSLVSHVYLTDHLLVNLRLEAGKGILDDTYAEAHFTMPAKLDPEESAVEAQPRWSLPDDDAGLEAYLRMLGDTDRIAAVFMISNILRAMPMVILLVMLQQQFGFQKKVSLLTNTIRVRPQGRVATD
ncbi:hypothetical protein CYMTET_21509 [Cymbomonas tetramitiformis]|uniref:Uncharacterized protein n=1 Tax=Cymbomonas tetramitiformis TaxID=36881 RepID=A0AAE0G227_9CHLO|nr:hypothetical protein CYMTET_21509 [Cymbomonas tetramitiformis]